MTCNKQNSHRTSVSKVSKIRLFVGVILGILVLFEGIKIGYRAWCNETTDDAQIDGNVLPLRTAVTGYIDQIRFVDNERVKKGDTLVIYDTTELKAQIEIGRSQVLAAQAELRACKAQVSASEYNVLMSLSNSGSMVDNISVAKAHAMQAEKEYRRFLKMNRGGAATEQTLDNMKTSYLVAMAQLAAAQKQFNASHAQVSTNRIQTSFHSIQAKQALAHIESARAQLMSAEYMYHHAFILAPCNGIVSKKNVEVGQFVPSGMALASIISTSGIWITANFKETQLNDMRLGQQVDATVDAYPGLKIVGKVESFCGAVGSKFSIFPAENATGNFIKVTQRVPVRIKIDRMSCPKDLLPGMNVVVSVKTK